MHFQKALHIEWSSSNENWKTNFQNNNHKSKHPNQFPLNETISMFISTKGGCIAFYGIGDDFYIVFADDFKRKKIKYNTKNGLIVKTKE